MPSSREDRDREILGEALKNLAQKKEPFFDRESWERDQEDLKGAIKDYEKDRRETLTVRPTYVAPGVNLINLFEPFASDSYFQKSGNTLYYRENFGYYTLIYRGSGRGGQVTFRIDSRTLLLNSIASHTSTLYEMVKPSLWQRVREVLTSHK